MRYSWQEENNYDKKNTKNSQKNFKKKHYKKQITGFL